jgi:beta-galactosidase
MAPWMHRFDARAMKDAGLNFVRLSHYPHHPAFLDACDDLGLLVYAEIATWKSVRGGRWLGSACRQMQDLVLRDRNRPCVIMWGMGNEGRHRVAYSRLRDVVRRLDPQRPVAYAENHLHRARRARTVGLPDVWGLNYELNALSEARRACALDNVIVTECSNRPLARRGDWLAQSDQVDGVERDLGVWRDAPWVAGFAVWSWNDYGTFRKKRYGRHCGIVDAWRQPKMAYAWLQARHAETPFLRVLGEWGGEAGRGDREIHVFTNCDRIRIRVAGKTVREAPGRTHIAERIPFEAGDLEVTGYRGDAQVSDRRSPYGPAQAVEIEPERCPADGPRDVASLTVCVVDARGRLVANWTGPVTLAVEGPGRIRFHDPAEPVRVVAGTGRGFVQGIGIPGLVTVTAGAPGLRDGLASVRFPETAGPVAEARIWVETPSGDRPK